MFSYHKHLIQLSALGLLRQSNESDTTEDNERNFARGYPTELFFMLNFFGQRGISSTNWIKQIEFCKGLPYLALICFNSALGLPRKSNEGVTTEDNNQNFARGSLTDIFLYLISFTNWSKQPKFCKGCPHVAFFSPSGSLQNQSQLLIVLQKK